MHLHPNIKYAVIFLLVVIAFGIVGQGDYEDAVAQEDIYCDFVDLWEKTNGRDGHPDWRGIYAKACLSDK